MREFDGTMLRAALAACALAVFAPAIAQQDTAGAEAAPQGLQEVVVTAQKRSENLQEVPIAVTAISGETIAAQHITNIQGLANTLPNVQINSFSNSPDSAVFTIRGVGVNDADRTATARRCCRLL
jgi:iron complex outermembrane receptor protein